jgi:FG-GAP-like repeat
MNRLFAQLLTGSLLSLATLGAHATTRAQAGVIWQNVGSGSLSMWEVNELGNLLDTRDLNFKCGPNCVYAAVLPGIYERGMTGWSSGKFDLLWWEPATNAYGDLLHDPTEHWVTPGVCSGCGPTARPIGTGHFLFGPYDGFVTFDSPTGAVTVHNVSSSGAYQPAQNLGLTCDALCQASWEPIGTADLNNDTYSDILWRNKQTGEMSVWLVSWNGQIGSKQTLSWVCGPECAQQWKPVGFEDFDGDGRQDLLWHNPSTGLLSAWLLTGTGGVKRGMYLSEICGSANGCSSQWRPIAVVSDRYVQ